MIVVARADHAWLHPTHAQTATNDLWSSAYDVESLSFLDASWVRVIIRRKISWLAVIGEIGGIIERLIILPEVMHCDAAAVLVVEISYHVLYQRT